MNRVRQSTDDRSGTIIAIIVVIVIAIILILVLALNSTFRDESSFGTWSPFQTTTCLNEGQPCTVEGVAQRFRVCTPNPTTGKGCLDSNGKQTFQNEVIRVPCTPICFTSVWSDITETPCSVYSDVEGTTLAVDQSCFNNNPQEFTYEKLTRTCVARDLEGTNGCVKQDGSLAVLGEVETILTSCETIPPCFTAEWVPCGATVQLQAQCDATAANCGRVIADSVQAECQEIIDGVPTVVPISNCNPNDNPGPCPADCFNFPCLTWPAVGYGNIAGFQNFYLEFFNTISGDYLEHDYSINSINLANNPIATLIGSNIITVTTAGVHTFLNNQGVDITGIVGPVGGVPDTEINGFRFIDNVTPTTFDVMINTIATGSTTGGGNAGVATQDQLARAQLGEDVLNSTGNVTTQFDTQSVADAVRFRILPSLANSADGTFYLVAYLPYNNQQGLAFWNGADIIITTFPQLSVGQTLDDLTLGNAFFFNLTEASAPYKLNNVAYPGPVLTSIYCGVPPCINADTFTTSVFP